MKQNHPVRCPRCSLVMDYKLVTCWVCYRETNRLDYVGGFVKATDVTLWEGHRDYRVAIKS